MSSFLLQIKSVIVQAVRTSFLLFRITIPILIATRILAEFGLIEHLGRLLAPVMKLTGLPGSMGLVWATAIITNLYTAIIVFASLAPAESLTIAQVTVLTTMMLVAHALPLELRIAQKAGPRFRIMLLLRLFGALVIGYLLTEIYGRLGYLQQEFVNLWSPTPQNSSWLEWALRELRNLGYVFLVILMLISVIRILEAVKIISLMTTLLKPVLNLLGIGKDAAPITIIGMTMGIGYGGGLILQEAKSGKIKDKDVFFSFCLMGLCHSLIEDTFLMMVMGGHLSGILWARMLFALVITFSLVKLLSGLPDKTFSRFFFRSHPTKH